ncbi:MAG: ADP-ribosylation factor-like protein [Candidatus Hermodarchaeota archaeon]
MSDKSQSHIFGTDTAAKITFIGLSGAGKTTLLNTLLGRPPIPAQEEFPTVGANLEKIEIQGVAFQAMDVGGQTSFAQTVWEPYVKSSEGVVFVFDASDRDNVELAHQWLKKTTNWTKKDSIFLFLANKKDLKECMPLKDVIEELNLSELMTKRPHSFGVYLISAKYNIDVEPAWNWFASKLPALQNQP